MYKLLENYLNEIMLVSNPIVQSFNTEGNICIYVWIGEYDNDYTQSEINIWDLLDFTYSKLTVT